ncbi:MAG: aspartate carbamoyltransferase [Nitrososphaeria archaeon]|nr:aspartate carbamoyltransferase [Aigarchaeota archaeon]MCX8187502.1 aspartate carbamoyltransferase [Nitrososphaeria archaeon]MDW8021207.1 aspartate carbamoyltransferase [Nitrososphaerota archaeon]
MGFRNRDIISILDFRREELEELFSVVDEMRKNPSAHSSALSGYLMATAFFEPSTRTRLSFQTAMLRLGGSVIDMAEVQRSSIAKGENFTDTIRMLDAYSDVIAIRHKIDGSARYAAEIAENPVINCGDGKKNHPTQAMLDLYTVKTLKNRIDGLNYGILGDLKYGRAAASLILGLALFRPERIYLISPESLRVRPEVREHLENSGVDYVETTRIEDCISELDVLYVTRVQKERFPDPSEYERVKGSYRLTLDILRAGKEDLVVLHPLPRVDEIDFKVDDSKYAKYFLQAKLGVFVRMALLKLILRG